MSGWLCKTENWPILGLLAASATTLSNKTLHKAATAEQPITKRPLHRAQRRACAQGKAYQHFTSHTTPSPPGLPPTVSLLWTLLYATPLVLAIECWWEVCCLERGAYSGEGAWRIMIHIGAAQLAGIIHHNYKECFYSNSPGQSADNLLWVCGKNHSWTA